MDETERQVKLCGGSLRISMSGRLDQSPSSMRTPTNGNHMQSGQRKMDFLFSMPRRRKSQSYEPYIPPHRRYQTCDNHNGIEKSKRTIVKPSVPKSYCNNSECNNNSEYTDSKAEYSASYNNKGFSDGSSSVENIDVNKKISHHSINKYCEKNTSIPISINDNIIVERVLKLINTHELIDGLKEILDGLYEQAYSEILPSELLNGWEFMVTLKDNTQCSTTNRKISGATKPVELPEAKAVPDCLELSTLEKKFWINIHCCKNVSELWGIILDANHLGKVEDLSDQMHSYYEHLKIPINRIIPNAYYALLDGSWHRVKCLQYNDSTATVFFIDRGDEDEVDINQLHKLSSQFCTLPAQAVKMSLTGLEIFADFDKLQSILIRELHEKSIFVEVTTVSEDYLSVELHVKNDNGKVININELIRDQMLRKLLEPKLYIQSNSVVLANISYLENRIFLQLDIPSLKYFNLLMEKATENLTVNEDCLRQVVVRHEINKIYFVKSNRDLKWYRGKIMKFINDIEIRVFLIDVGSIIEVNRNNIISLEKVCNIMAKYPPQAIEVQLDQIPILGSKILSSLQNVVSRSKILHVKFVTVADNNNVYVVQLLKKTESNFFTSINDALLLMNEETSSKKEDTVEETSSRKDELVKSRQLIDTSSNKDFSTSSVLSTKSSKSSKTMSEAGEKKLLKIDKEKILKIREMHKNTQDSGKNITMYLSSVLAAPIIPNDYFDVHVFMSSDPSHFVIQLLRNKTLKFNKMICKMSETCRAYQGPILTCDSIKVGRLYACKLSENNNRDWCRAYVTEIRDKKIASVYCCDYGSYKTVDISNMVPLENEFYRLPYQAIWAELSGVKPTSKEWTVQACLKFQEFTQSKNFVSRVVSKKDVKSKTLEEPTKTPVTKEVIYSLDLIDTSSEDNDINIADLLIQHGVAERC